MNIINAIEIIKKTMLEASIIQEEGLGDDLFLFTSTVVTIVNVGLVVIRNGSVLLSWRNDIHY